MTSRLRQWWPAWGLVTLCTLLSGCQTAHNDLPGGPDMPRETSKVNMPDYIIEAPDILLVNAVRVVPLPPYHIETLDSLFIQASGVLPLPTLPINGPYLVDPEGTVNLGLDYGSVSVVGLTIPQAREAIESYFKKRFNDPKVVVALFQGRGTQQIRGEHLVRQDGTVGLGIYGSVRVSGLTLEEAKAAIEAHLSTKLQHPEISLDVLAYNSKVYYIIFDGGGNGMTVFRQPITGNETVLDALSLVNGLPVISSTHHVWIARPGPAGCTEDQILPVDWNAVTKCGRVETNYQLLPGDRVYVQAQGLVWFDTALAKFFAPIERIFGITLLGQGAVSAVAEKLGQNGTGNGVP